MNDKKLALSYIEDGIAITIDVNGTDIDKLSEDLEHQLRKLPEEPLLVLIKACKRLKDIYK